MLRIFTPVKIQRLRPVLNPQIWVPEASMLTTIPPKPSSIHERDMREKSVKEPKMGRLFMETRLARDDNINEHSINVGCGQ